MMQFKGISFSGGFASRMNGIFSDAQKRLDSTVIRRMRPYVPMAYRDEYRNAGKMRDSFKAERPGVIISTEPRARREYYTNKGHGEGGLNAVRGARGLRGKYSFERMKADNRDSIRKEVWGK